MYDSIIDQHKQTLQYVVISSSILSRLTYDLLCICVIFKKPVCSSTICEQQHSYYLMIDAYWCRLMPVEADWCCVMLMLILIDVEWCWLMLIDADWCLLMLIYGDWCWWCWLVLINADILRDAREWRSAPTSLLFIFRNTFNIELVANLVSMYWALCTMHNMQCAPFHIQLTPQTKFTQPLVVNKNLGKQNFTCVHQ